MGAIPIVLSTLAAKCTLTYFTDTIVGGLIEDRAGKAVFDTLPNYIKKLLELFKNPSTSINYDLEKAILSSHWMATKIVAEQMMKNADETYKNADAFIKVINVSKDQLNRLKKENYKPAINLNNYPIEEIILKDTNLKQTNSIKGVAIELHLAELRSLVGSTINLLGYEKLQDNIRNGFSEEKLDWFELVSAFFNELLKGDNNKAKDAFQNQELAKIGLELSEIKQVIIAFEFLITSNIRSIGEDRLEELKASVKSELTVINNSLLEIAESMINLHGKVDKLLEGKKPNLNNFPDYQILLDEIKGLNTLFEKKQAKKQEIIELLTDETDERKKKYFEKDLDGIDKELIKIDGIKLKKSSELVAFKDYIENTWFSLYSENSPISSRLLKARELFECGDLKGANAALDPFALQKDYNLHLQRKEIIKINAESLSQEFLAKANFIFLGKEHINWFEEAKKFYLQAVELYESYDTCFLIAYFLQYHNQILEAEFIIIKWQRTPVMTTKKLFLSTILALFRENLSALKILK